VREHSLGKVPNLLVVGRREAEEGTVALRELGKDGQTMLSVSEVIVRLEKEGRAPDMG